jgi:hypothetical protein
MAPICCSLANLGRNKTIDEERRKNIILEIFSLSFEQLIEYRNLLDISQTPK